MSYRRLFSFTNGGRRGVINNHRLLASTLAVGTCFQVHSQLFEKQNQFLHAEKGAEPAEPEEEEVVFGVTTYPANDPTEDRVDVQRLDVLGGWWFACFDGHGGWQAAEFAQRELHRNLEVELGNRIGFGHAENNMLGSNVSNVVTTPGQNEFVGKLHERLVAGALVAAFERTDRIYKSKVQGAFEVGFGRDTRAGSCALGALLVDGVLYVANLGDSRAVLGVNRDAYNALDNEQKKPPKFQNPSGPSTSIDTPSPTAEDEDKENDEPAFHVTEYLRRAAVMKAHGEKLNPEVEAKLREVLAREVQAQDVLITGRASTFTDPASSSPASQQPPPKPTLASRSSQTNQNFSPSSPPQTQHGHIR
jgi:hypothetical protein